MDSAERVRIAAYFRLFQRHRGEAAGAYDDVATIYDGFARVWDQRIAAAALARYDQLLARWVRPGTRVLDVGTGTGERTLAILRRSNPASVVALDASRAMLAVAERKIGDTRVAFLQGDALRLPFPDGTFDVVSSAWVVEILDDPRATVQEYVRVIKPDGVVVYAFCSLPVGPVGYVLDAVRQRLDREHDPLTHLLAERDQPFHRCERSSIRRFAGGLTTVATVAKCCPLTTSYLPCRK